MAIVGFAIYMGQPASAQTVPESAEPEHIERQFERPVVPRRYITPEIPAPDRPLPPEEAEKIRFVFSGVAIQGTTVFRQRDLAPLYVDLLAKQVSLADIYDLAEKITQKYKDDGYLLSRAFVPAQKVPFGNVRIVVIEGFVDRVVIKGQVKGSRGLIESYARKITESRPLRRPALERYVLLMNDLPGVTARTALRPSKADPAAYDLILKLEHKYVDAFANVNNHGSRFVGPIQFLTGVTLNSVAGLYERTQFRYATAKPVSELRFFDLHHQENIGDEGTKLALGASSTFSEPGFTLADDDLDSRSLRADISLSHPIIRSRRENLIVDGSLVYRNSSSTLQGARNRNDRLRVVRLGATYHFRDGLDGRNRIGVTGSQGVNILNASTPGSPNLSRADGRSNFTKVELDLARVQPLTDKISAVFTAAAQKSADPLLSAEEFLLGGRAFGRAFDPAELTGDDGGAFRLKLQFTDTPETRFLERYQFYGFYDLGAVWNRNAGTDPSRRTLASVGGGVSARFIDEFSGYLEVAQPLLRAVEERGTDGRSPRLFFGLNARF